MYLFIGLRFVFVLFWFSFKVNDEFIFFLSIRLSNASSQGVRRGVRLHFQEANHDYLISPDFQSLAVVSGERSI